MEFIVLPKVMNDKSNACPINIIIPVGACGLHLGLTACPANACGVAASDIIDVCGANACGVNE